MTRDVQALRAATAQGAEPKFLFFWGHQPSKDGSVTKSCFSQWFDAPFTVVDTVYRTAEHYMTAEKARLFGDVAIRNRVLAASIRVPRSGRSRRCLCPVHTMT